jgi:MFS family permease
MQTVSLGWLVLELGGSPIQLGAVVATQYLPPALLGPLGGVLADRVDRRRALVGVQLIAMLQAVALLLLLLAGVLEIGHLFVLSAVLGVVNAADQPLRQAFAAQLVPRSDLMNAIALNATSLNLARTVGPALAGVAIGTLGIAAAFAFNAASYAVVLVCIALIDERRLVPFERQTPPRRIRESLVDGVRHARSTPAVRWPLVLLAGVGTFALNFQTLLPLYAQDPLGLGPEGYGALFATMGIGSLAGSLWLASLGSSRRFARTILGGGVSLSVLLVVLGLVRWLPAVLVALFVIGFSRMAFVNTINVTIQSNVPDAMRGRVMSLYTSVFAAGAPIGGLVAGALAQARGAPAALLAGGVLSLAVVTFVGPRLARATEHAQAVPALPAEQGS